MRVTAAAALAEIFTGRLSFDLPDDTPPGFFDWEADEADEADEVDEEEEEEEESFEAMAVVWVATDQYNRAQPLIV